MMSNLEQGITAYEESDFTKAFEILMPLAQAGNLMAKQIIGNIYYLGEGVERDIEQAIKWHLLAAQQDYKPSQEVLLSLTKNDQQAN